MKTYFELYEEFSRFGYVVHECPTCGSECEPTEADNDQAICEVCECVVNVVPLV